MATLNLRVWESILVDYVRSGEPDLTNRQMAILMTVYSNDGPHTVRGLAHMLNVSKPVITRALNKLGDLDYLRRQRDESDGRNIFVITTSAGAHFLSSFEKFMRGTSAAFGEQRATPDARMELYA